ncbi:MAG: hypothetical protein R3185_07235 [Candidatus Thermoplasmatota archaeon]|nr:hypothetical protein [Candidatus Thermoplasmatota archaeon]
MDAHGGRPGGWRNAAVGALFIAIGITVFFTAPSPVRWQVGGAGMFLGLFVLVVLGPWEARTYVPDGTPELYRSLQRLATDLSLEGPAIYIPAGAAPGLDEDRVLLSETQGAEAHPVSLQTDTALVTGKPRGLSIEPPGRGLLDAHEAALGIRVAQTSLAELNTVMDGLLAGRRLVRGVTYRRRGEGGARIRFRQIRGRRACERVRQAAPSLGGKVGCPVESALLLALARATGSRVWLEERKDEGDEVELRVGVGP